MHEGLDVQREIHSVVEQELGDTVLVHDACQLKAFAVCHFGSGTEAGAGTAYVKFGAVHPGPDARSISTAC
ncbi:GCN5-related N-acetyltransferase (fragment) [Cupriavidus necator]|uniref:GCN5-related N-acetyltransferase n=1 Tax=Cupriavidus necator TaxID=106590 RepID=A0A1K0JLB2_CUPNE